MLPFVCPPPTPHHQLALAFLPVTQHNSLGWDLVTGCASICCRGWGEVTGRISNCYRVGEDHRLCTRLLTGGVRSRVVYQLDKGRGKITGYMSLYQSAEGVGGVIRQGRGKITGCILKGGVRPQVIYPYTRVLKG